jgi:O-antigen/teichoic acid export membrane protein
MTQRHLDSLLVRNSLWGLVGSLLPAALAIPTAGLIARALGAEGFGLFLLLISLLALASVLDGGVAHAVTRLAAQRSGQPQELGELLATGLVAVLAWSLPVLAAVAWQQAGVVALINPSPSLLPQLKDALPPLAVLIALQLVTVVFYGLLEGLQHFRELAFIKLANGVLAAVLPAVYALSTPLATLDYVLWSMMLARLVGMLMLMGPTRARLSIKRHQLRWSTPLARGLFAFGGWVAVSNVVSPVMNYVDRFILSSTLGARQAAAYLAAAELVGRAAPVPAALSASLFPRLCADLNDHAALRRAAQLMISSCAVLCACLALWGDAVLRLWLGQAFQPESMGLLRILLLGFLLNAIAHLPFARLHAAGHSRTTAILHAAELLPFLGLLYALVQSWGPTGAAVAWVLRMGVDLVALLILDALVQRRRRMHHHVVPVSATEHTR